MSVSTHIVLDGPRPVPPPFNLVATADASGEADRWGLGVEVLPYPAGPVHPVPGSVDTGTTKAVNSLPAAVVSKPFGIELSVACTTRSVDLAWLRDRASAAFAAFEPAAIELEFSEGAQEGATNTNLLDAATYLHNTPEPMPLALGRVEQAVRQGVGGAGMIHMTTRAAEVAVGHQLLKIAGSKVTTLFGTPVVVGTGYSGAATSGATANGQGEETIYGTDMVRVLRGPLLGLPTLDDESSGYNWHTNDERVYIEREVLIAWAAQVHVATRVALTA